MTELQQSDKEIIVKIKQKSKNLPLKKMCQLSSTRRQQQTTGACEWEWGKPRDTHLFFCVCACVAKYNRTAD